MPRYQPNLSKYRDMDCLPQLVRLDFCLDCFTHYSHHLQTEPQLFVSNKWDFLQLWKLKSTYSIFQGCESSSNENRERGPHSTLLVYTFSSIQQTSSQTRVNILFLQQRHVTSVDLAVRWSRNLRSLQARMTQHLD